jgi:signal transduction histidine kinase
MVVQSADRRREIKTQKPAISGNSGSQSCVAKEADPSMSVLSSPRPGRLLLGGSIGTTILAAVVLLMMPAAIGSMLSSGFMPHAMCFLYNKQLTALHAGSDTVIWISYLAISITLVYLVWRTRREMPFSWMFLAFGSFIVACGFTHLLDVVVLWKPYYWLSGDVKLVTAVASAVTAMALPALVPQIHTMLTAAHVSEDRRLQLERANAELQHLSAELMRAQDNEQRRIARELHDGVGQYLAAIKMSSNVALDEESTPEDAKAALKDSLDLIDKCSDEVRTMSHLLYPPLIEEMGLTSAVPWYVRGFAERSGIKVDLDLPLRVKRLPGPIELALFRILQESLTNIHRHSGSKTARIQLHIEDDHALLEVEDFGKGFGDPDTRNIKPGIGITSMRARVRELGGELRLTSKNTGAMLQATLPIARAV